MSKLPYQTRVTAYISEELREKLDSFAKAYGLSRAAALRILLGHGHARYMEQPIHRPAQETQNEPER
jgi:Ribbon-helix-helix protein, copG family